MSESLGPVPRPRRLKRAELRDIMLSAGVSLLMEDGLANGADKLTYADVFRRFQAETGVKLSRAQVHGRIWDSVEDYRQAVLVRLAYYIPATSRRNNNVNLEKLVASQENFDTVEHRVQTKRAMIREGAKTNIETIHSLDGQLNGALWSLQSVAVKLENANEDLGEALRHNRQLADVEFRRLYQALVELLNLGPSPDLAPMNMDTLLDLFTRMVNAYSSGLATRWALDSQPLTNIKINLGPDNAPETWDVFSLGILVLADYFFTDRELLTDTAAAGDHAKAVLKDMGVEDPFAEAVEIDSTQPIPREALERRLIEVGAQLIRENGLGHGAEQLTYAKVFERVHQDTGIKVARAQVHGRIWDCQDDFQVDVLAAVAGTDFTYLRGNLEEQILPMLSEMDMSTQAQRSQNMYALTKAFGSTTTLEMANTTEAQVWSAVARLHSMGARPEAVEKLFLDGFTTHAAERGKLFSNLSFFFGMRVRPELGLDLETVALLFGQITDAFSDGVVKREAVMPGGLEPLVKPSMPQNLEEARRMPLEDLPALGHCVLALSNFFFEPDPNFGT